MGLCCRRWCAFLAPAYSRRDECGSHRTRSLPNIRLHWRQMGQRAPPPATTEKSPAFPGIGDEGDPLCHSEWTADRLGEPGVGPSTGPSQRRASESFSSSPLWRRASRPTESRTGAAGTPATTAGRIGPRLKSHGRPVHQYLNPSKCGDARAAKARAVDFRKRHR
jgi:hypothetical protein